MVGIVVCQGWCALQCESPIPTSTSPARDGWALTWGGDYHMHEHAESVWLCPQCARRYYPKALELALQRRLDQPFWITPHGMRQEDI
jgi:hypothetical protein